MSWPQFTIDEACLLITDGTHYTPPNVGEGIPFLTVKDFTHGGEADFLRCSHISESEFAKADAGNSAPIPGDVLFSKDGTVGKVFVVESETRFAVLSSMAILRPDSSKLDPNYFGWVLKTDNCLDQASRSKTGSAIRRIILKDLKRVRFPLPPLEEQKRIAAILDAADDLRTKRRESIALLDDLLQSTFLELFGDPVTNPKGWNVCAIKDTGIKVRIGPFGSLLHKHDYVEGGIPLVNPKHIINGKIIPSDSQTVSPEKASTLGNYRLEFGDVVMGRRGEMGRCAIVGKSEAGMLCGTGSILLRPNVSEFSPEFLAKMLSSQSMVRRLEGFSQGVTMPNLNRTLMGKLEVIVPPISEQRHFEEVITAISQQGTRYQKQLNELDTLFASLQSRAFRGEL